MTAVRAALGADWARLARELLLESTLLGVAGGALGLGLGFAYAGLQALVSSEMARLPATLSEKIFGRGRKAASGSISVCAFRAF